MLRQHPLHPASDTYGAGPARPALSSRARPPPLREPQAPGGGEAMARSTDAHARSDAAQDLSIQSHRSPEPGARSPEPGARSPEPGARSPERSPEPGARSPEPGARSPEPLPADRAMKPPECLRSPARRDAPADASGAARALRRVPGALALLALALLTLPLLALLAPAAEANSANCSASSGPYPAHEDWALTPSGLDAGDKFRLLFATSGKRRASSVITDSYNESVRSAAKGGHGKLSDDCAKKFAAIISTEYDSARFNTKTRSTDTGASIWWLTGEKVADDYADFYDGSWDSRNAKNEWGTKPNTARVWTGSLSNGEIPPSLATLGVGLFR